ncbi:hypothetical protein [Bacillus cereus]
MSNLFIRASRKEDFLDLIFELANVHTTGFPLHLVRSNAFEPVLLTVHFPPQHIVEEVLKEGQHLAIATPVKAMLSGPSRLVFKLPDYQDVWPLTLDTLLNWKDYKPVVPKLPDSTTPFTPYIPEIFEGKTALEIPTGLYLSPEESAVWYNIIRPEGQDGRFVLWHTILGEKKKENENFYLEGGTTQLISTSNHLDKFNSSLTQQERNEIVQLTRDFSLPKQPVGIPKVVDWLQQLKAQGLPLPSDYKPSPINIRRLMLSSAGAWANIEGAWNYPWILKDVNDNLGYVNLSLEQWQHRMTQGRDQFVKTVKKAFLCDTGHRVAIVKITERRFEQEGAGPKAVLRQYKYIEVREPFKNYENLDQVYKNNRREMPFKWIKITDRTTPHLKDDKEPFFWPTPVDGNEPFRFKMVAEDWDGNIVSFERPLMCVRLDIEKLEWVNIVNAYNKNENLEKRTAKFEHQPIAFAETEADSKGKTTLETENVTFRAQLIDESKDNLLKNLPFFQPRFLPEIESAKVTIPAAEQFTGQKFEPKPIVFEQTYLKKGFDRTDNKGEIFVRLAKSIYQNPPQIPLPDPLPDPPPDPLKLSLPTEKAGGLITPNTSIAGLSRALGPVDKLQDIKTGTFDPTHMFVGAKFLGGIELEDILGKVLNFDPLKVKELEKTLTPEQLVNKLNDPTFKLEAPMLTNRRLQNNAIETRFFWKPVVKDADKVPFFKFLTQGGTTGFKNNAQLTLDAQMVTPPDGRPPTYRTLGNLKEFALEFANAMLLKFTLLRFTAENGKKMDVTAEGLDLVFKGPLEFVETLKNIIPANAFSDPPFIDVTASGIRAGFTLGIPAFGVGIFSLQNINLSAALSLPFVDQPVGVTFSISERQKPFTVSVMGFAGGGFFSLALSAKGIQGIEASIEFGGNISINLGVASGGVHIMAGIYFGMTGEEVKLTGYLRCGGNVTVLGLVSVTVEFYLGLTYRDKGTGSEVWGQATLTVGVKIAFFSKSISLTVERRFAGASGDPSFAQIMGPEYEGGYPYEWEKYCMAFA